MSFARFLLVLPIALYFALPGSVVSEDTATGTVDTLVETGRFAPVAPAVAAAPPVVTSEKGEDRARAEWAFGQFEAAGLGFSDLEVRFAGDPGPCDGNLGEHRTVGDTHLVLICNPDAAPPGSEAWSTEQADYVAEALERFELAGLDVPTVKIEFPQERNACEGFGGIYLPSESVIRICWMKDATIVHELAHALLETNLTERTKAEFLELRGLTHWVGGNEWADNGAEQAAEILTWGLLERDITIDWIVTLADGTQQKTRKLFKFDASSPKELAEGFHLLTGKEPTLRETAPAPAKTPATASPEARRSQN